MTTKKEEEDRRAQAQQQRRDQKDRDPRQEGPRDPADLMSQPPGPSPAPNPPSPPGGEHVGGDLAKRAEEQDRPGNYPAGAPDAGTGTPETDEPRAKRGTREPMSDTEGQRATNPGPTEKR